MQQGDPLGPLLFCLTLHQHCQQLKSELSVLYLDDVTIGVTCEDVMHDLGVMKDAERVGLFLNASKSEIISEDMTNLWYLSLFSTRSSDRESLSCYANGFVPG